MFGLAHSMLGVRIDDMIRIEDLFEEGTDFFQHNVPYLHAWISERLSPKPTSVPPEATSL
jgi:hypothetical protein